ncbi:MAG TPA: cytochrome c3 family protein [Longimicrobiales bacterium]|nr:cytochrome c3 family protein [Longimicrobiales bacterium]
MTIVTGRRGNGAGLLALALGLALGLSGCGDRIIYRNGPDFVAPPNDAGGFLGYSAVESRRTTCGNCHIGKQAGWEGTAHADAWATLESSGHAQDFCRACHSVSSRGNAVDNENVGWVATGLERYQDVQCESCHGPGLTHVTNPDAVDTKPLAALSVGVDMEGGCGECHSGTHRPFVEEWSESKHALISTYRHNNPSCSGCHNGKEVLKSWGVKSTFLEQEGDGGHIAITCAVCHDPHDARHEGQLRFAIDVPSVEQNLCMKCHHKRGQPDLASPQRGPHSPEGPLLLGEAGWLPPNFAYPPGALVGSHGSDRNPRLCATCHVNDYQFRDPLTDAFQVRATGHSFQAIPCADAEGVPTGERDCQMTQRSFRSCTECHLSETAARSALSVALDRLDRLATEAEALLARVPASEFSTTDNVYTTAEGAKFNVGLARKKGSAAHNPFLVEALLIASIRQLEIDYGVSASRGVSLTSELAPR